MNKKKIYVTKPDLPELDKFYDKLKILWDTRYLTNNGPFHKKLEQELADFLGVKYVSLITNGTIALIIALKALDIKGEVITTPFTFPATTHALYWNGLKPVFCDIRPTDGNIDPDKIESLITEKTVAILPVHVYGNPCDNDKIQQLANKYNLKVIYDAAHAFGVEKNHKSILNWGDLSILSFHATKVFNTLEGGAIITNDYKLKQKIDRLKNFGIIDEVTVIDVGINGKMSEVNAIMGLLQLEIFEENRKKREKIFNIYINELSKIPGVKIFNYNKEVKYNYSYFPIFIDKKKFGLSRDELYMKFRENNVWVRKYFYPLTSQFQMYKSLESADAKNIPVAIQLSEEVLCLPIYSTLDLIEVDYIINIIKNARK